MGNKPGNKPFGRLLLTGAAGNLGRILRVALRDWADVVRCTDIAPMEPAGPGEEVVVTDLADRAAVLAVAEGVDADSLDLLATTLFRYDQPGPRQHREMGRKSALG